MNIIPEALLSEYTTFQLGGPCEALIDCRTPLELLEAIEKLAFHKRPFILIGGGSNLVVSDEGINITVIRYYSTTPHILRQGNDVVVSGSTILDHLAQFCIQEGLAGLNYTSGIPGTVGGAVVGNAGAWGKQVGDVLKSAIIIDKNGKYKEVTKDYFKFEYRHSALKETNEIISSVKFGLQEFDTLILAKERLEILKKREEKHPNLKTHPCAGSFFRNIEATSKAEKRQAAGWFLEEAGGKLLHVGGAEIFNRHANIIVKGPNCTAQDVYDLHLKMKEIVKAKFNLDLNREVRFVGPIRDQKNEGFW